jgi:hypothetical protein
MRSNCLLWALRQWRREGGYIALRRTTMKRRGLWCHFFWSPDLVTWKSYVPQPAKPPFLGFLPRLWFKGVVVEGDAE